MAKNRELEPGVRVRIQSLPERDHMGTAAALIPWPLLPLREAQ